MDISLVTIPTLLMANPQLMVRQWKKMFDRGKNTFLTAAAISTSSYACLAYRLNSMYAFAAITVISAIPYTVIFLGGVNGKLMKMAKTSEQSTSSEFLSKAGSVKEESAAELVNQWGTLNFVRALFALSGTFLGVWTALS